MCHEMTYLTAYEEESQTFDFSPFLRDIAPYLQGADLSIGNLETTLAKGVSPEDFSGFPSFKSPDSFAAALRDIGIDVFTTCNNHCLDARHHGLVRTLDVLDGLGVSHCGTARTRDEFETPLIVDVQGIKVCVLPYTYAISRGGLQSIPNEMKDYSVKVIDRDAIQNDIKSARQAGAQIVLVSLHYGPAEYVTEPSEAYRELALSILEAGADAIIGHHPHVLQPIELVKIHCEDGTQKTCPILYSLGNFFCNPSKEPLTACSLIAYLTFEQNGATGEVSFSSLSYLPIYLYRVYAPRDYRLLPIGEVLSHPSRYPELESSLYKLRRAQKDIVSIAGQTHLMIEKNPFLPRRKISRFPTK